MAFIKSISIGASLIFALNAAPLQAMEGPATDCTQVEIEQTDGVLTLEEEIQLMEQSFLRSLEKNSECISQMQESATEAVAASGNGGGGGGGGGGGNGNGSDSDSGSGQSDGMDTGGSQADGASPGDGQVQAVEGSSNSGKESSNTSRGGKDQIIKPAEDNALCMLVYEDIQNENNSKRKAGLIKDFEDYGCN